MNYINRLIICFIMLPGMVVAQNVMPTNATYKVENNKILLRWQFDNIEEIDALRDYGCTVNVYDAKSGISVKKKNINLGSATDWDGAIASASDENEVNTLETIKRLLFLKKGTDDYVEVQEMFGEAITDEDVAKLRLKFINHLVNYNFQSAVLSGLGVEFNNIDLSKKYRVSILINNRNADSEISLSMSPSTYEVPEMPNIIHKFDNRYLKLRWETADVRDHFFGYWIEMSYDGENFHKLDSTITINPYDHLKDQADILFIEEEIALEENYKNYYFRVYPVDYFGKSIPKVRTFEGMGYEPIVKSPIITLAEQTDDNEAHIVWDLDQTLHPKIKNLEIQYAESEEDQFLPIISDLPIHQKEVYIPLETTQNYYKVVIVPKVGDKVESFPIFIMGQDTIAPVMPANAVARLDSVGNVMITWDKNTEEDLWGYRVFKGVFESDELSLITPNYFEDNFYYDENIESALSENVYYRVIAADKRGNRSPFTDTLHITLPDTIPPGMASIRDVRQEKDSIIIDWYESISKDAVKYRLFKRVLPDEKLWTLIYEVEDNDDKKYKYIDTLFEYGDHIAYTVIVEDDDGLKSEPCKTKIVQTKEPFKLKVPFSNISSTIDFESEQVVITWEYTDDARGLESILVYKGPDPERMTRYKYIDPANTILIEEGLDVKKDYYYKLKPIYKDRSIAKKSDVVMVHFDKQ